MNKEVSNTVGQTYDDEINLRDIFIPLWKAKYRIFLFGLISLSLVLIYSLGGFVVNKSKYASLQVHFNFQGVEAGNFPNGEKFSPQQLVSGSVLSNVYNKIDSPTFTYLDLVNSIKVLPSFNGDTELKSVVTRLLSTEKGLTNTEYSEAVSNYAEEITAQSKKNVIITLDLNLFDGNLKKASDLLVNIPTVWATAAIQERGVLKVSTPTVSSLDKRIQSGELLIQVNVLADTSNILSKSLEDLSLSLSNKSISDSWSGMTLTDIRYKLDLENKYRISILKELVVKNGVGINNKAWYKGFRDARVGKLRRERSSLERMVVVYEQALIEFNQQQYKPTNSSNEQGGDSSGTTVYAPQYGKDIINRLLDLGSKMSDPEYRKSLLQEKIKLSTRLQEVITEVNFYEVSTLPAANSNISIEEITILVNESFSELQKIHAGLIGIINVSNMRSLDDRGQLYDLVGSVEDHVSSNLSRNVQQKAILAFIIGCMLGTVVVFIRQALR